MGTREFLLDRAKREGIKKGRVQGVEEGQKMSIEKILRKGVLTIEQIAETFGIPVDFVLSVKRGMLTE